MTKITITMPNYRQLSQDSKAYDNIAEIFHYIHEHWHEQPSLAELASMCGYSEDHLQRLFKRWMGISPKKLLGYLTLSAAKTYLRQGSSVMDTAYDVGLSGGSRLHDLFLSLESMTPGEYKKCGSGMQIFYGWHATPFGEALVMVSERGLCGFAFTCEDRKTCFAYMSKRWALSSFTEDNIRTGDMLQYLLGNEAGEVPILLKGTGFQVQIWEALLRIPVGGWSTYGDLAKGRGMGRAVGGAVGMNPISLLIPCHRVIAGSGVLNGYRWGLERKAALLAAEGSALGLC